MKKLLLPPDQASYAVASANEVIMTKLDGGAGRYRRDILNASRMVNCQWTLTDTNFEYINVFYQYHVENASEPFLIDLYLDKPYLTEHQARFIPGSFGLTSQMGLTFVIGGQLEVKPVPYDSNYTDSYLMLVEEYGSPEAADDILNLLEKLVNVDLLPVEV